MNLTPKRSINTHRYTDAVKLRVVSGYHLWLKVWIVTDVTLIKCGFIINDPWIVYGIKTRNFPSLVHTHKNQLEMQYDEYTKIESKSILYFT